MVENHQLRYAVATSDAQSFSRAAATRIYRPALDWVLAKPKQALPIAGLVFASSLWLISQTGGEFMPQMNEGDLIYMPSALPGISTAKARCSSSKPTGV